MTGQEGEGTVALRTSWVASLSLWNWCRSWLSLSPIFLLLSCSSLSRSVNPSISSSNFCFSCETGTTHVHGRAHPRPAPNLPQHSGPRLNVCRAVLEPSRLPWQATVATS